MEEKGKELPEEASVIVPLEEEEGKVWVEEEEKTPVTVSLAEAWGLEWEQEKVFEMRLVE